MTAPLTSSEEPPYETKGSVTPVSGSTRRLPPAMIAAWTTMTSVRPVARSARKSSAAAAAMRKPRSAMTRYRPSTASAPSMPSSSAMAAKTKSVCISGIEGASPTEGSPAPRPVPRIPPRP